MIYLVQDPNNLCLHSDDEDLLQIVRMLAMEEIDIRWQVAMITARIRKFMRKTGRPIDLKPKNGITFDKSKIECFNCQKLGFLFARWSVVFDNIRKTKQMVSGKGIVPIEDSNSKALVATDNNEDIDWTKEFDAEPVTFAMMALTELEEDDWSMEGDLMQIRALWNRWTRSPSSQNSVDQGSRKKGFGHKGEEIQKKRRRFLKDYAIIDSGCSGSMTGDKDKLSDFKEFKGGYVAFGNDSKGGRISGKGTIKTSCLDFEKVSYVEELKFNLLSVSQICDKKHNVLFTDKECLILSPKFKFVDEDLVILRAPRKNDGIQATKDEAVLWHRRLGHVNFKNINKLVQGNLVRGLPSKTFKLDHSCLACRKGKQAQGLLAEIEERTVRETLELSIWIYEQSKRKKVLIGCLDLELLTPSMILHACKERILLLISGGVKKESTADKKFIILKDIALHDGLIAFEEERGEIALTKGKSKVPQTFEEVGSAEYNNMDHTIDASSTPTLKIHKNHP
ncbi:putative ribonuclease H-like domain-containing protein [Tanacetum coccineum]